MRHRRVPKKRYSAYMLSAVGFRTLGTGLGALLMNLYGNLMEARTRFERSERLPYSVTTVGMMASNVLLTESSKVVAPLLYTIIKILGKLPWMIVPGILEGGLLRNAQWRLETYGGNPPDAPPENHRKLIRIVVASSAALFAVALTWYTNKVAFQSHNTGTWAATGGILGSFFGSAALSLGSNWFWKNPESSGALLSLFRLFFMEYPNWFNYVAADMNHAIKMNGTTEALFVSALSLTGFTAGNDVTRGLIFSLITRGVSQIGMIALTGYGAQVPSLFPVPIVNGTLTGG